MVEQAVDHRVALVGAGAAGEHEGREGEFVERELAQDELRLARVTYLL